MRVFVTGASGFVGSAIVNELIKNGHQALGLARSESSADKITKAGAEVYHGDINNQASMAEAAAGCDAVIHTAFNHDFTRFKANCEDDRKVIEGFGDALAGTGKPLIVTSGVGLISGSGIATEDIAPPPSSVIPRAASEEAAHAARAKGTNAYIVRLPPTTHGAGDHGFVTMIIDMAKKNGVSAYIGEGNNLWPAGHRFDAAALYRLIAEQKPEQMVYHAVAEEGIPFKDIAAAIGNGLNLPVVSKTGEEAQAHFGWFSHFAAMGCRASSAKTRETLGWQPVQPTLMEELVPGIYL